MKRRFVAMNTNYHFWQIRDMKTDTFLSRPFVFKYKDDAKKVAKAMSDAMEIVEEAR